MAIPNTNRSRRGSARASNRAPSVAPPSTPEHHRHGDAGVDVAAGEVDARAGGGGHADHEVAGRRGHLERQTHRLVHGQHLDGAGADAEQAREHAGHRTSGRSRAARAARDTRARLRASDTSRPGRSSPERSGSVALGVLRVAAGARIRRVEQHERRRRRPAPVGACPPRARRPPARRRWWRSRETCRCGCWCSLPDVRGGRAGRGGDDARPATRRWRSGSRRRTRACSSGTSTTPPPRPVREPRNPGHERAESDEQREAECGQAQSPCEPPRARGRGPA